MATVAVTSTFCNSNTGSHASVTLRVNNVVQGSFPLTFDDLQEPITEDEKATFARLIVKLRLIGKTPAQLRSDMISGFTVTV